MTIMDESKRLFLAVPIDDHFKNLIKQFIAQQNIPNVKWVVPENWHVTVLFLGDFPTQHLPKLILLLNEFFQSQRFFSLDFDRFIYKPNQSKPSMIWAKFHQNSYFDLLCHQLEVSIKKLCSDLSIPSNINSHPENIPHVTLSRLKNPISQYPNLQLNDMESPRNLLRCDCCTLYESLLTPNGPKYSPLTDFTLTLN